MNTHLVLITLVTPCLFLVSAVSEASVPLYEYGSEAGNDPSSQGWTVIGAGTLPTLVSCDDSGSGWRLCDSATNGALGIVYDWNGRAVSGDWSVTMGIRWEKDKIDASGNVPLGGYDYFQGLGNKQNFVWRVGDGKQGYYEICFGKGEGSTVTVSGSSSSSTPVSFAGFGEEVELTLAVSRGAASLMVGDRVILEQVDRVLSDEECSRIFFGDATGGAQGSVTLQSVRFVPEPSGALLALAGSWVFFARRRRMTAEKR